jgi:hypothetical protein
MYTSFFTISKLFRIIFASITLQKYNPLTMTLLSLHSHPLQVASSSRKSKISWMISCLMHLKTLLFKTTNSTDAKKTRKSPPGTHSHFKCLIFSVNLNKYLKMINNPSSLASTAPKKVKMIYNLRRITHVSQTVTLYVQHGVPRLNLKNPQTKIFRKKIQQQVIRHL